MQKKRPALVVSNRAFSRITGMVMVCPITSTIRNYPLRVALDARTVTHGEIACDRLRTLDYIARGCKKVEAAPKDILDAAIKILNIIVGE
jgi:toxin-antitoxin system, toxin component, mazF family